MLELVFEDGGTTHRIPVRGSLTLGRSSDNDVVLRDFSVSRHHARVEDGAGGLRIVDLESTNGIRINEDFVTEGDFKVGDTLGIGNFDLHVENAEGTDVSSLTSATYMRPLSEFNQDYGLEGQPQEISKEVGARERVFEILAQVAKVLIQVEELEPVLEKVMDLVFDHLMVDRGFIVLFDDSGEPRLELNRVRESQADGENEVPISRTILDMVAQQQVAILTHDAQADQRFEAGRSVRIHQIRSAMCAPVVAPRTGHRSDLRRLTDARWVLFGHRPRSVDRVGQLRGGGHRTGATERPRSDGNDRPETASSAITHRR